jgi:hypothetical protein
MGNPALPFDDVPCPAFYRLANVANLIEFQVFIGEARGGA